MIILKLLIVTNLVIFLSSVSSSKDFTLLKDQGKVDFTAIGKPSFLKIKGHGPGPTGHVNLVDDIANATIEFDLNDLKTGIELRDEHMKDNYLEVKKFSKAKLIIKDLAIDSKNLGEQKFKGVLNLHGQEKEISGTFKFDNLSEKKKLDSNFSIKLSDFGVKIPEYKGITIADEVKITIEAVVDEIKSVSTKTSLNSN